GRGEDGRRQACRALRFASCASAVEERVRRLGSAAECDGELMFGLFGSRDRAAVIQSMERRLSAPEAIVDETFLRNLGRLALAAREPRARPSAPFGVVPATNASAERWQAIWRSETDLERAYARRLEDALPRNQGQARAVGVLTLLGLVEHGPGETSI